MNLRPDPFPGLAARTSELLKHAVVSFAAGVALLLWASSCSIAAGYTAPVRPLLAIIIDDLGDSPLFARKLASLHLALTFSVIPHTRRTLEVLEVAREAGLEVILHQPMEPVEYPKHNPGQGALFTSMDAAGIQRILQENFTLVPGIAGMNNHMGSRFTQDEGRMELVLEELKQRGLFMVDSLTHPRSQVVEAAARVGVPCLVRDIFLDNVREERAVLRQLHKAEAIARRKGRAIAIGHPKGATLDALASWSRSRDTSILLLPVSGLLRHKAGQPENLAETHSAP